MIRKPISSAPTRPRAPDERKERSRETEESDWWLRRREGREPAARVPSFSLRRRLSACVRASARKTSLARSFSRGDALHGARRFCFCFLLGKSMRVEAHLLIAAATASD